MSGASTTGYASGTDRTACLTLSIGSHPAGDSRGSDTTDYAIATSTGKGETEPGQAATRLLQMWKPTYAARLPPRRQATVCPHQTSKGRKRGRSGTGVSSFVTKLFSDRAVLKTSAIPDGQDDWTVVKQKQNSWRQAGEQSGKLTQDNRAKDRSRLPLQKPSRQPRRHHHTIQRLK